jgi:hypothetical protein
MARARDDATRHAAALTALGVAGSLSGDARALEALQ